MEIVAFVRLENTNLKHYKFYEMEMYQNGERDGIPFYDIVVKYGRINTKGKRIFLRSPGIGEAEMLLFCDAERAFLKQLKSKLKDKEYALVEVSCSLLEGLKNKIEDVQNEYDGYVAMTIRLEERSF